MENLEQLGKNIEKEKAYVFIKNDYLNGYASTVNALFDSDITVEQLKKLRMPIIRSFSERYEKNSLDISKEDEDKIKKLDELSIVANNLLEKSDFNRNFFLEVAISAAEVCDRSDIAEKFKGYLISDK